MTKKKVVCLDGYTLNPGDNPWDEIEGLGAFACYDRTTDGEAAVIARARDAHILLTNKTPISAAVIDACPHLEAIAVLATGYNVVDIAHARTRGIPVMNVPVYGTDTVAEMTFALILQMARNVATNSADVRDNLGWTRSIDWSYWLSPQIELAGKTIGIIGFGNIGRRVGEIASAFRMEVLAHDKYAQVRPDYEHTMLDLDDVIRRADFLTLHCPALPDTIDFMNADKLALMKQSAFLINTSRGQLVVEKDLAAALNEGRIAGAALDTLQSEPPASDNPLLTAKNCVITPHVAWATLDARKRIMRVVAANIRSLIAGQPENVVN